MLNVSCNWKSEEKREGEQEVRMSKDRTRSPGGAYGRGGQSTTLAAWCGVRRLRTYEVTTSSGTQMLNDDSASLKLTECSRAALY